jgi:phage tail-like protein
MSAVGERLYGLLPAVYRERDAASGGALRALLAVLESELVAAEQQLDAQYENWFVETCDPEFLARIGDLVGLDARTAASGAGHRALVADAIGRRRRKGVAVALEDAARDATGWQVRVVEYFRLLVLTQHCRHPRAGRGGTVDLRDRAALAGQAGAFASLATRPDVRRIAAGRGRHNVPSVGLFVWRDETFTVGPAAAAPVPGRPGYFTVHPLGVDTPLATPEPRSGPPELGRDVEVVVDGRAVDAGRVRPGDLGGWPAPGATVVLDARRGRLAFPGPPPERCEVRYSYRTAGRVGGGPYDRRDGLLAAHGPAVTGAEAVAAALAGDHDPAEVLTIGDDTVVDGEVAVTVEPGAGLWIQAADGARPVIRGDLRVHAPDGATVTLDGLLIGGRITVSGAARLTLRHCTALGGLVAGDGTDHEITLASSVAGPIGLPLGARLTAADSVIEAVDVGGVDLARVTVLGAVTADRLDAIDTIFAGAVEAGQRQHGSLRYCYAPPGSHTPVRSGCQPDLALGGSGGADPGEVALRVRPRFRAVVYGAPGYADLASDCPVEIAAGAEEGNEMGAYAGRLRPRRDAALRATLDEHLPYGLEAGIIDVE